MWLKTVENSIIKYLGGHTMKKLLAKILTSLILSTSLFAGTRDPFTPDEKYIEYGAKFKCVLSLCGVNNDDTMFCGSCVAISPKIILTAAHVVKSAKHGGVSTENGEVVLIEKFICHKDYDGSVGNGDIAICLLKEKLNLDFYPKLYEDEDEVGKLCSMSGYGLTGTFITGQILSDGKKRAGSNKIDSIYENLLICSPSKPGIPGITTLEFIICSGDSGGGLFIDGKLAGINSCVLADGRIPCSIYGDESGHTRISKYASWILENKGILEEK